jgi:hypothetical protein
MESSEWQATVGSYSCWLLVAVVLTVAASLQSDGVRYNDTDI